MPFQKVQQYLQYRRKRMKARAYERALGVQVERPIFRRPQLSAEGYHSQSGQDKWVIETLFPGKKDGVFVDIGANDGVTFSNTLYLEQAGWGGVLIEPIPSVYAKLIASRSSIAVNGCIAPAVGKRQFRVITGYSEMLSGLVDDYDERHLERIQREIAEHGGAYQDIEVDCYNFNELMESHGIAHVDYLNIDVEGAEFEILSSIDFGRTHIAAIGVENNYFDRRIPDLLGRNGFAFHSVVGDDEFYRNRT